jgi:hypothetical protein
VSFTIFKQLCRKYGVERWPYRRLKAIGLAGTPPPSSPALPGAPSITHAPQLLHHSSGDLSSSGATDSSAQPQAPDGCAAAPRLSFLAHAADQVVDSTCCWQLAPPPPPAFSEAVSRLLLGDQYSTQQALQQQQRQAGNAATGGPGLAGGGARVECAVQELCTQLTSQLGQRAPEDALVCLQAAMVRRLESMQLEKQQLLLQLQHQHGQAAAARPIKPTLVHQLPGLTDLAAAATMTAPPPLPPSLAAARVEIMQRRQPWAGALSGQQQQPAAAVQF